MTDPDPEFPATAARILRGATRLLEGLGYAAIAEYTLGNGRRADILAIDGAGQVTISWTGTGTLQESTNLANWTLVPGNPTSPYVVPISLAPKKFYRVQQ